MIECYIKQHEPKLAYRNFWRSHLVWKKLRRMLNTRSLRFKHLGARVEFIPRRVVIRRVEHSPLVLHRPSTISVSTGAYAHVARAGS